ncbi:MAG: oligoribonuclease [Gammaproteobacteria bacterium]|jgi:oligoribonuclease|nr:MAG: oligoribonuclease [Gammaproteobacteria bacterium TMED234]|tara:strand:+ start:65 stop:613 length:549 start_codon:yes stop_codon:yes gene_type:complete
MKTLQSRDNLIWIDLEMTGLDPNKERIIEIATLVTDSDLNILAEGPNLVISQPIEFLDGMDEWNQNQHGSSGLIEEVKNSNVTIQVAEIDTLEFISKYVGEKVSPMCGNTVSHDRRFLSKYMPRLESYFNYRHIDVSSFKEAAVRWMNEAQVYEKKGSHRALGDIKESVAELKFYKELFMPD